MVSAAPGLRESLCWSDGKKIKKKLTLVCKRLPVDWVGNRPVKGRLMPRQPNLPGKRLPVPTSWLDRNRSAPGLSNSTPVPIPQLWRLLNVKFANGLTLERAQVSPDFPPAGGRLVVHTNGAETQRP